MRGSGRRLLATTVSRLVAIACVGLVVATAASAGDTATLACLKTACHYDVRIDVSLKNATGAGIPSRGEGAISARLRATFKRVPFRELRIPGGGFLVLVKRGLKTFEADTSAPGTLRATVDATTPCRINRSYSLPALLTASAKPGWLSVDFGPAKAPASSGCAGTAFGLQKIVVGGWSFETASASTNLALGEVAQGAPGNNDLGVLAGSYYKTSNDGSRAPQPPVPALRAGRGFTVSHTFTQALGPGKPPETAVFRMTFTRRD